MIKCLCCGETRIIQRNSTEKEYDVVFGCCTQYHIDEVRGIQELLYQDDRCKESQLELLKQFNELTPAEHERLAWLAEELGEVIQIIGKIYRHGYESAWPPESKINNKALLHKELVDVMGVLNLMHQKGDLDLLRIMNLGENKQYNNCYLHHQNI